MVKTRRFTGVDANSKRSTTVVATPRRVHANNAPRSHRAESRRITYTGLTTGDVRVADTATATNGVRLSALCSRRWSVYRVSPLFGIHPVTAAGRGGAAFSSLIASWQSQIEADVNASLTASWNTEPRETVVDGSDGPSFAVRVAGDALVGCASHLGRAAGVDDVGLKIAVFNDQRESDTDNNVTPIATIYLMNVGGAELDEKCVDPAVRAVLANVSHLPLMLVDDERMCRPDVLTAVVRSLEAMCDCLVTPLNISLADIRWAMAVWSAVPASVDDNDDDLSNKNVITVERMVDNDDGTSAVTTSTHDQRQLTDAWHRIHDKREMLATQGEIDQFHDHLDHCNNVDVDGEVTAIDLPAVGIRRSPAKICLHNPDHVLPVLQFLTELCQPEMSLFAPLSDAYLF